MFKDGHLKNIILVFFLQVTDKRDVEFVDRLTQIFEGHGELLGGETKPSRLVPTKLQDSATGKETQLRQETIQDLPGECLLALR